MDRLSSILAGTGSTVVLADRDGRVLRTVEGGSRVSRMLRRRGVDAGAVLTENHCGNNGVGTALELAAGVHIRGEQHYSEVLRDFACYGHPVVDPLTHRLVGVVDLTGLDSEDSRLFAAVVRGIVTDIETRYVDTARSDDRRLWRVFSERTRHPDATVCAFGDEVVLASRRGLDRLAPRDLVTLRRLSARGELGDRVELSVGVAGVSTERVGRRGRLHELVLPEPAEEPSVSRSRPRHPITGNGAMTRALVGPAGSGTTTLALELAGADAVVVAIGSHTDPSRLWREEIEPQLSDSGPVLVLDDVDLLPDEDLRRLATRIRASDFTGGGVARDLILTVRRQERAVLTEVVDSCAEQTTLRPLHERGPEAARIVQSMITRECERIDRVAPRVAAGFIERVCGLDLPAGLISLRSILREALENAGRDLTVDHLPARAHSARVPRAGELARGEYDAIVAALADCGGVRSRAARRLGISRTTLYSHMRQFGLS